MPAATDIRPLEKFVVPPELDVRISAIVDVRFDVIADAVSARSWTITEARE
ncbi:hypothetical protein [Piscinibacter koreensis]|uniref:Uncharacterized protein n=1 Tax=Piscinibacter koreensis TaxID=2742824 RepID=A0A7Y6NTK3_9BURK|nr:hypothetical protein [Schlegelella koreensis]NUZ09084.1 hypothetical protein [Schlegelella koreensis]